MYTLMSTDIPQVPKNDYEELKCKYLSKGYWMG